MTEIQPSYDRYSQGMTEILSMYDRDTAKLQLRYSQGMTEILPRYDRDTAKV